MSALLSDFAKYCIIEWGLTPHTAQAYIRNLQHVTRDVGDPAPGCIGVEFIVKMKSALADSGLAPGGVKQYVCALKAFLRFCREGLNLETFPPKQITCPRIPRREVIYLTPEEVAQFVAAIPAISPHTCSGRHWMCFRTVVEVLLGTGLRISECLSLRCSAIRMDTGVAQIIGKRNKERIVFFTPRALEWVQKYLRSRTSTSDVLFANVYGKQLSARAVEKDFRIIQSMSGLAKKVTPHTLRHTVATTLLFNGCPLAHIKVILGHEDLQTTCQYYLGTDRRIAKQAHERYLDYTNNAMI